MNADASASPRPASPPAAPPAAAAAPKPAARSGVQGVLDDVYHCVELIESQAELNQSVRKFRDKLIRQLVVSVRREHPQFDDLRAALALIPPADEPAGAAAAQKGARLDWGRAAELIALGLAPEQVAAALGGSKKRILRNLERSKKFTARIERERRRLLQLAAWRVTGVAERVSNGIVEQIDKANVNVLLRLFDRLPIPELGTTLRAKPPRRRVRSAEAQTNQTLGAKLRSAEPPAMRFEPSATHSEPTATHSELSAMHSEPAETAANGNEPLTRDPAAALDPACHAVEQS
jgi:hypothetical protein